MRLWTLHPKYLDTKGLLALWREGLLAQKVLRGETVGYRHHPQLARFRAQAEPVAAIAGYLRVVLEEAGRRGYQFDAAKVPPLEISAPISATSGQLAYEWRHLLAKLAARAPALREQLDSLAQPDPHPLFVIRPGDVEDWEIR